MFRSYNPSGKKSNGITDILNFSMSLKSGIEIRFLYMCLGIYYDLRKPYGGY